MNIYNLIGQKVSEVVNGYLEAGLQSVVWNGVDDAGNQVSSGVYFYRLKAGDFTASKKMVLLK